MTKFSGSTPGGRVVADCTRRAQPDGGEAGPPRTREIARAEHAVRAAAGRSASSTTRPATRRSCARRCSSPGLDPAFAAENVGYFTAPYAERAKLGTPKIDRATAHRAASRCRTARYATAKQVGSQGCVTLPIGRTDVFFKPSVVKSALPGSDDAAVADGRSCCRTADVPAGIDAIAGFRQAVDAAFDPAGMTAAFVVTYKGPHHRRALRREHHARPRRSRAGRWARA